MKGQKERENKKIELNAASHKKEKKSLSALLVRRSIVDFFMFVRNL